MKAKKQTQPEVKATAESIINGAVENVLKGKKTRKPKAVKAAEPVKVAEPEQKYVLPSFVTAQYTKSEPVKVEEAKVVVGPKMAEQQKKEAKPEVGKRAEYDDNTVVSLLTTVNPKKAGTSAFDRFEQYVDGMTVTAALAAGITRDDLRWDAKHKYISLKPVSR